MRAAHERAVKRAEQIVAAYKVSTENCGDYDEVITDIVADLTHYVHELQVDREMDNTFEEVVFSAVMIYEAEIEETPNLDKLLSRPTPFEEEL